MDVDDNCVKLGPFSLNVEAGPDRENWLSATVRCEGNYGRAWAQGSILLLDDIAAWIRDLERMNELVPCTATFVSTEPCFHLVMRMNKLGQIAAEAEIFHGGPNAEKHCFEFEVDQSYLPAVIARCRKVLQRPYVLDD